MSLKNVRILNTRPRQHHDQLNQAITQAGGTCLHLPSIDLHVLPVNEWIGAIADTVIDHAIFISPHAVHAFFQNKLNMDERVQLKVRSNHKTVSVKDRINTHVTAIGQATAAALAEYHVHVDACPHIADSEHLLQLPCFQHIEKKNILLIKGSHGRDLIQTTLQQRGAQVIPLMVYRTTLPLYNKNDLYTIWHENTVDIILYTSQQGMQNIFTLFGEEAHEWLCNKPCVVLSSRLEHAASRLGIKTIIVSDYKNIIDTLRNIYDKQR